MVTRVEITVTDSERKIRLEDLLCLRFPALSKMYLREIVKTGACEVNGRHENRGKRLLPQDFIEVNVDLTRQNSMLPQEIPLDIVYEDADLLVVDKPAGMLVHPSHCEKNVTLLNAVVHHLNSSGGGAQRPGLIHRLDKDTSGLIVIARNARAHRILCLQFHNKKVLKRYVAHVDGIVEENIGTIVGNIGRNAEIKFWELRDDGKHAETKYTVIEKRQTSTLLELEPVTGRTNQLRIHCASLGHPIIGDVMRGGSQFRRMCLHSARLSFRLPSSGQQVDLTSTPDFL